MATARREATAPPRVVACDRYDVQSAVELAVATTSSLWLVPPRGSGIAATPATRAPSAYAAAPGWWRARPLASVRPGRRTLLLWIKVK